MGEQTTTSQISNVGYQDFNIIQLRLDTQKLIKDIENQLKGVHVSLVYNAKTNEYTEVTEKLGTPLVNDQGFQNIMTFVISVINPHTVQGNTEKDDYYELMYFINETLNEMFLKNSEEWGINIDNAGQIIASIVSALQLFLSRTVGDKERESLKPLIRERTERDKLQKEGRFV